MNKYLIYIFNLFVAVLLIPLYGAAAYTPSEPVPSISVLADPSLALPLTELARDYSRKHHVTVSVSYEFSGEQARRIEEGEEASIFITAMPELINSMKTKGLVDVNSERLVALNHLVLAGPAHSVLDIDLATKPMLSQALSSIHTEPKLLLLTPETFSAGAVSLRKLESLGLLEDATPLFIYVDSIQELQREFQAGQRYFFYYANQLKDIPDAKEIDRFDESVRYHAVVVASEDMDSARKFLQSLGSMGSRQVFEKYGLTTP